MIAAQEFYPPPVIIPDDNRVYAIGDIQGECERLKGLLDMVAKDLCDRPLRPGQKHTLVFLGDYVDRGPDAKGTIDICIELQQKNVGHVFIEGNHDDDFRFVLRNLYSGSITASAIKELPRIDQKTSLSYNGVIQKSSLSDWKLAELEALRKNVPRSHIDFLENLSWTATFNQYLFIHQPYFALEQKRVRENQDGINQMFSYLYRKFGDEILLPEHHPIRKKIIVHGHLRASNSRSFEHLDKRIGLCETIQFHRFNDRENYAAWEWDAQTESIHCAVLEKGRPPGFLTFSEYIYCGPGG